MTRAIYIDNLDFILNSFFLSSGTSVNLHAGVTGREKQISPSVYKIKLHGCYQAPCQLEWWHLGSEPGWAQGVIVLINEQSCPWMKGLWVCGRTQKGTPVN